MGGPSKEAKANAAAQTAFFQQTVRQQELMFAAQVDLLDKIKAVTLPILAKGPHQYGFTPEEDALLREEIVEQAARGTQQTVAAEELRETQRSGGVPVPTGAQEQLATQARALGEQEKSRQLIAERVAGYERGRSIFAQSLSALSGVGNLQDPVRFTTAAASTGEAASRAVKVADEQRSHLLQTLLGGAIQGGLALATGGLSKALNIPVAPVGGRG